MRENESLLKSNKAITLIALVITIIVLLILAGVTIATLTGDNGLLQKSTNAKQTNEEAKELELIKLAVSAAKIEGEGTLITDNLNDELQKNFDDDKEAVVKNGGWIYQQDREYTIFLDGKVELGNKLLLPLGYQQVEYIKATGTQYIDTDILSTNAKIEITFKFNEINNKSQVLVNCKIGTPGWFGLLGQGKITLFEELKFDSKNSFVLEYKNNTIKFTDEYNNITKPYYETVTPDTNFTILSAGKRSFPCLANVYSAKIYSNDELVRNYIPCYNKESGKVGLYDTVEEIFFTDAAGGNFEKGPDV